jgi:hypothetical protein
VDHVADGRRRSAQCVRSRVERAAAALGHSVRVPVSDPVLRSDDEVVDESLAASPKRISSPWPPEEPSREEIWELDARVSAFGSQEVNDLLRKWEASRRQFWDELDTLLNMKAEKNSGGKPDDIEQIYGRSIREQIAVIKEIRQNLDQPRREVRSQVARELRSDSHSAAPGEGEGTALRPPPSGAAGWDATPSP